MTLRKLLTFRLPEPPSEVPGVRSVIDDALALPMLLPLRLFWDNLVALRPWWPVLLPLLLWTGWRAYRKERAVVLMRAEKH